ncbi:hypothetical protein VULLAG_LOCUS17615 [Vulpes lagopus]
MSATVNRGTQHVAPALEKPRCGGSLSQSETGTWLGTDCCAILQSSNITSC